MATVRGMTPEAIKALLRKEMGDYQALTEAVSTAKVASENATKEVEDLREKINNADFNIDMSKYDKAMEKYQEDLEELNTSLSEAEKAAIEREKELSELLLNEVGEKVLTELGGDLSRIATEVDEFDRKLKTDFSDNALQTRIVEPVVGEIVEYMESDEFEPLLKAKAYADREGGVGEKQLVDASVIAKKLADGAVVQDKIAANAVVSDKIAAEAIVASKLAANSVVAGKIAANAVLAENIAANTITGNHIQANSITANKLTIRPGNLFPDPHFKDECWGTGGAIYAHENNGGELRLFFNGNDNSKAYAPEGDEYPIIVEAGAHYRFSAVVWANNSLPIGAMVNVSVLWKDKNSSEVVERIRVKRGKNEVSFNFKVPDNLTDKRCTIAFSVDSTYDVGQVSIWNVSLVQASDGNLIVDGSIYARHLTAGSVTTDSMSVNSINGDRILADTLDAKKIRAKSLTSDHVVFKNGFIENAMIKDGTIESGKIKALDAGKITSGTIDADRIGAKTITGDKIVANSITAGEIRADAFIQNGVSLITSTNVNGKLVPDWKLASAGYIDPNSGEPRLEPLKTLPNGEVLIHPDTSVYVGHAPIRIVDGAEYEVSFSIRCNTDSPVKFSLGFMDENDDLCKVYGGAHPWHKLKRKVRVDKTGRVVPVYDERGQYVYVYSNDYGYGQSERGVIHGHRVFKEPGTFVARFSFDEALKYIHYMGLYFYVGAEPDDIKREDIEVYLADLKIQAVVPNQKEIDKNQDNLIEDLQKVTKEQAVTIEYLKRLTKNVASVISRSSFAQPEMVHVPSDTGYFHYTSGLFVMMPQGHRTLKLFMPDAWIGRIRYSINYRNGSTYWYTITADDFVKRSLQYANTTHGLPNDYPYSECLIYTHTVPIGSLESFVGFINTTIVDTDIMEILEKGDIGYRRPLLKAYTVFDPNVRPPWTAPDDSD